MKVKFNKIKNAIRRHGFLFIIRSGIRFLFKGAIDFLGYHIHKLYYGYFIFKEKKYSYFISRYNTTWRNERAIEIPLIYDMVTAAESSGKKVLEIGNVLSHYFEISHDVVDKYEKGQGVINADIVDFSSTNKYDLIVAISTLEHVGFDESPQNPLKTKIALENLIKIKSPNGRIVVTFPIGYNPYLDELIKKQEIIFTKIAYMKRTSLYNTWKEASKEEVENLSYERYPIFSAKGLFVGFIL